jgi:hypothetical protein
MRISGGYALPTSWEEEEEEEELYPGGGVGGGLSTEMDPDGDNWVQDDEDDTPPRAVRTPCVGDKRTHAQTQHLHHPEPKYPERPQPVRPRHPHPPQGAAAANEEGAGAGLTMLGRAAGSLGTGTARGRKLTAPFKRAGASSRYFGVCWVDGKASHNWKASHPRTNKYLGGAVLLLVLLVQVNSIDTRLLKAPGFNPSLY